MPAWIQTAAVRSKFVPGFIAVLHAGRRFFVRERHHGSTQRPQVDARCLGRRGLSTNERGCAERRPPRFLGALDGIAKRQELLLGPCRTQEVHSNREPVRAEARLHAKGGEPGVRAELTVRAALAIADPGRLAPESRIRQCSQPMFGEDGFYSLPDRGALDACPARPRCFLSPRPRFAHAAGLRVPCAPARDRGSPQAIAPARSGAAAR